MSDEHALANQNILSNLPAPTVDDDTKKQYQGSGFIPYMKFAIATTQEVADGKCQPNQYIVMADSDILELGGEIEAMVLSYRVRAWDGDNKITALNPESNLFKSIASKVDFNSMCQVGSEYLLYVPSIDKVVTFFMGSKTARNMSHLMDNLFQKWATLSSQTIKTSKFTYRAPKISPCSQEFSLPSFDVLKPIVEKFVTIPENEDELAAEAAKEDDRER